MGNKLQNISSNTSFMLDSLRIIAAFTVLIYHAFEQRSPLIYTSSSPLGAAAHAAVIVFFVLSGYLIAYTTNRTPKFIQYLISRLSRLCAVVIPALIITFIIQVFLTKTNPELVQNYLRGPTWLRYFISAGFLNEIWFFSSAPPLNSPLWSLSYEFWYYIAFGLWFYAKKTMKGLLLPILACLIMGPKILLLMPVWLLGTLAYNIKKKKFKSSIILIVLLFTLLLIVFEVFYLAPFPDVVGKPPLYFSSQFFSDYFLGFLIAFLIWVFPTGESIKQTKTVAKFRLIADLTFPIYLLHFPLLLVLQFNFISDSTLRIWSSIISVLIIASFIGYIMEINRPNWTYFFKKLFEKFNFKGQIR